MADGDQTIAVTSNTIAKTRQNRLDSVWEVVLTATFDADDTTDVTSAIPINGVLRHVTLYVPDTTNAVTKQLQIKDNGDNVIFDTGELANVDAATTYNYNIDEPLAGIIDVVVGVSGAAGGTTTAMVVTLRGI